VRFDPYAADPEAYSHVFTLARHLAGRAPDTDIRSLVELRASQMSGCAFCLDMHARTARDAQVAQRKLDLLAGWREAEDFSARERIALALTEEMVGIGGGGRVTEETWARVRAEFDDAEIAGLLYTSGLIRLRQTVNVAVEFPPGADLPKVRLP
jgi:AhpD family alkylhydroperoxidase